MHDRKKGKSPSPNDFNPYCIAEKERNTVKRKAPLSVLKDIFVKE
jgi:hypothetical protein